MPQKEVIERREVGIPLFYERFQEERDKRFSSEIGRLESEIRHNGESIDELKSDIARLDKKIDGVRDELKSDIASLRDELKSDIASLRDELKSDIASLRLELHEVSKRLDDKIDSSIGQLRREMQGQFRWMMSLLLPIILGVVALLIQNLLKP